MTWVSLLVTLVLLIPGYAIYLVVCVNTAGTGGDIGPEGPCILTGTIYAVIGSITALALWVLIVLTSCCVLIPNWGCYKNES